MKKHEWLIIVCLILAFATWLAYLGAQAVGAGLSTVGQGETALANVPSDALQTFFNAIAAGWQSLFGSSTSDSQ